MRATDVVATAARNTFRSKLRTTLTVLALFVGAFTLTLTTAVGAGVTDYVTKQVASLGAEDVFIVTRAAEASTDGPVAYDPETSSASDGTDAPGLPGSTGSDPLTEGDLDEVASFDGIRSVDPIQVAAVDFVEGPAAIASSSPSTRRRRSPRRTSSTARNSTPTPTRANWCCPPTTSSPSASRMPRMRSAAT